jgi:hypothetical protein
MHERVVTDPGDRRPLGGGHAVKPIYRRFAFATAAIGLTVVLLAAGWAVGYLQAMADFRYDEALMDSHTSLTTLQAVRRNDPAALRLLETSFIADMVTVCDGPQAVIGSGLVDWLEVRSRPERSLAERSRARAKAYWHEHPLSEPDSDERVRAYLETCIAKVLPP